MSICYWPALECDCDNCADREDHYEDSYDDDDGFREWDGDGENDTSDEEE